ncbi:uncharacterized protein A4U43_C08F27750 [Asparagus officinalis]|uniref:xyloglucan endotransglucosylase/hydrolase protein 9-like n=1 Tax=Asparagus officinalis TaxID=4686 RepID=UPI00098DF17B|nr:xyloglucan endotransglucosylase/hydrolase protein 9-like [Asparagus officinalis]ONK61249.1 uncharacterized protein A4U43_C08F27750 [Asparagus officinalis]
MAAIKLSLGSFLVLGLLLLANAAKFDELFEPSWALDHVAYDGQLLQLKLDNFSGAGFASKNKYLYGRTTSEIKLVPGDSPHRDGILHWSDGPRHTSSTTSSSQQTARGPTSSRQHLRQRRGNREQVATRWLFAHRRLPLLTPSSGAGKRVVYAACDADPDQGLREKNGVSTSDGPGDGGLQLAVETRTTADAAVAR